MPAIVEAIGGGRRLRQARVRTKLSQSALATRVGVSQNTVSSWERGQLEPTLRQCNLIARALGLNWQTPRLWWEPLETGGDPDGSGAAPTLEVGSVTHA